MRKVRLDALLVERGLAESRTQAQQYIRAGWVRQQGAILDKPGMSLPADAPIELTGKPHPYVSRGGVKLAAALDEFGLDPTGQRALDVGASTGGFTDCLLQRGAEHVTAVDVGHNQLAWKLRSDPRVTALENHNARSYEPGLVAEPVGCLVMDVSFISATQVLPGVWPHLREGGWGVVLVKPQFEAGREAVEKGGLVRDEAVRQACLAKVSQCLSVELGAMLLGSMDSPIEGPAGNREYLLAFRKE